MMTSDEFAEEMKQISIKYEGDLECRHKAADDLMCGVLRELGYLRGVILFEEMYKWYA